MNCFVTRFGSHGVRPSRSALNTNESVVASAPAVVALRETLRQWSIKVVNVASSIATR
jgi:hypothetical protein